MVWSVRASGTFHAPAVRFTGTQSIFTSSLGAPSSPLLSFSFWFKPRIGLSINPAIFVMAAENPLDPDQYHYNYNPQGVVFRDLAGTGFGFVARADWVTDEEFGLVQATIPNNPTGLMAGDVWHHILGTVDIGTHTTALCLDDQAIAQEPAVGPPPGLPIDGAKSFYFGHLFCYAQDAQMNCTDALVGDVAEFWWALGQDIRVDGIITEEMRRKFITANGRPVPLGMNGELPTGTAPTVFGHGNKRTFLQPNLGTATGQFSLVGTFSEEPDTPPQLEGAP